MRILDRHFLATFLAASAVFLVTLLLLTMVIDFATKAEKFLSIRPGNLTLFVLKYYFLRIPVYLHFILPMVAIFAGAFTMIRMGKNNELLPILTSGTSLRRAAAPALLMALFFGAADAAIEELVLPPMSDDLGKTDELLVNEPVHRNVTRIGPEGTHVSMEQYDHLLRRMIHVRLTQLSSDGRKSLVIVAAQGDWIDAKRAWLFQDGYTEPYDANGDPVLEPSPIGGRPIQKRDPIPADGYWLQCDFTPKALYDGFRFLNDFATIEDLRAQIRKAPNYRPARVMYYSRFSFPFTGLILVLVGIPAVSAARVRNFFKGISVCVIVVLVFYCTHLASLELGFKGRIDPWQAAWGSILVFGPIALWTFLRMKT